jgi:hypothetical protein
MLANPTCGADLSRKFYQDIRNLTATRGVERIITCREGAALGHGTMPAMEECGTVRDGYRHALMEQTRPAIDRRLRPSLYAASAAESV